MTTVPHRPRISRWEAWSISFVFWIGLGLAATLMASLALAPRWLEVEQLQLRYARNAAAISDLQQETQHLARVAAALQNDRDFLTRVASSELRISPAGGRQIPVTGPLTYDSRIPQVHPLTMPQSAWYFPLLEAVANSPETRFQLGLGAILLIVLAFFCMNETFARGGLQILLRRFLHRFEQRYAAAPRSEPARDL